MNGQNVMIYLRAPNAQEIVAAYVLQCCGLRVHVVILLETLAADFDCCALPLLIFWLLCQLPEGCYAKVAKVKCTILPLHKTEEVLWNWGGFPNFGGHIALVEKADISVTVCVTAQALQQLLQCKLIYTWYLWMEMETKFEYESWTDFWWVSYSR